MKNVNLLFIILIFLILGCKRNVNNHVENSSNNDFLIDEINIENDYTKALTNANGFWRFEKATLYGGFVSDKDYYYTEETMDSINKDISFRIIDYHISYSNGCSSEFSIEKVDISSFFAGKLVKNFEDSDPSNEEIRAFYKKFFNIAMEDTLVIFNVSSCQYPFNRLLVFANKIIVIENGVCNFSFTKEINDSEKGHEVEVIKENSEVCNKFEGSMSGGELCTYYGKTMKQVYPIILIKYDNESKHLKKALPPNNIEYSSDVDDENVQITYKYENKNKLHIQLSYGGGFTEIELQENDSNTISKITYNAD